MYAETETGDGRRTLCSIRSAIRDSVLSTFSIVLSETDVTGIGIVPHFDVWFGLAGTQECLFPTRP